MKLRKSRKGAIEIGLGLIPNLIFLFIASLSIVLLAAYANGAKQDFREARNLVLEERILFSDAITYTNPETKKPLSGVIDPSKLNDESLKNYFSYLRLNDINVPGVKITLEKRKSKDQDFKDFIDNLATGSPGSNPVITAYINKQIYDKLSAKYALGKGKEKGSGSSDNSISTIPVLYYDETSKSFLQGYLTIDIYYPNS